MHTGMLPCLVPWWPQTVLICISFRSRSGCWPCLGLCIPCTRAVPEVRGNGILESWGSELPGQLQESLGPFGKQVSRGVSPRVSPKTGGVRRSVRRGVSGALRAPGSGVSKKCPESVPGVSGTPCWHSGDTFGTLFGHSGAWGPKGPRDTRRTLRRTPPVFGDTLGDTPRDTCFPNPFGFSPKCHHKLFLQGLGCRIRGPNSKNAPFAKHPLDRLPREASTLILRSDLAAS